MWDVGDIGCLGCRMFGMWDFWDVGCLGCGTSEMWDVRDVECWGCGMFGVWHVGCGMWNVLPGCGILIYKMMFTRHVTSHLGLDLWRKQVKTHQNP